MEANDKELLRQFAENHSDEAFSQLVSKHLGLVLGAAQRQLRGDLHAAEDLAQQVFLQLAQKAPRLLSHSCLEGWLFSATRLACLDHIRKQVRQTRREQEAAMNLLDQNSDSRWEELSPVLDEALATLPENERNLILLRHMGRQSSQLTAAQLGITEAAARKQLERALDHLRAHLSERGVALSALALIGMLETQAQAQVSPILVTQISSGVLSQTGTVAVKSGLSLSKLVLITGTALLILALYPIFHQPVPTAPTAAPIEATVPQQASEPLVSAPSTPVVSVAPTPIPQSAQGHDFRLFLVDAQTKQPVSGAKVIFWAQPDERSENRIDIQWTTNGCALTHWTNDCEGFIADVQCENYAMTRIQWKRELNVLPVPGSWTLQLEAATPIGGIVVDTEGQPIALANVKAWSSGEFFINLPGTQQPTVSHPLGWMSDLTTSTDSNGRWQINTLARCVLDAHLVVLIDHPDYVGDRSDMHPGHSKEELRHLEFRSVLQRNHRRQITGVVLDASGISLTNAEVTDGTLFNNPGREIVGEHHVNTDANGAFSFITKPDANGKVTLTAKAPGFAPKTATWSGTPITLQLQPGHSLKLHVVGPTGDPVAGIRAETTHYQDRSTHCDFYGITDTQGEVFWNDVPNEPILITFFSDLEDFQSLVGQVVEPSEQERSFNLLSSLKINGTVTDAESGKPIGQFRVGNVSVYGSGDIPDSTSAKSLPPAEGRLFEGGHFQMKISPSGGPLLPSDRRPGDHFGVFLKITADGYEPQISRFIDAKESETQVPIRLRAKTVTSVQRSHVK